MMVIPARFITTAYSDFPLVSKILSSIIMSMLTPAILNSKLTSNNLYPPMQEYTKQIIAAKQLLPHPY